MNIANKLTVLRVLLTPLFLVFLYWETMPYHVTAALVLFCAAAVTDYMDGRLARKRGLVTDFGKFLDPLADKILVMAAIIAFIGFRLAHPVAVIVIIAREFLVSGIRLLAVSKDGTVIAANWWGKVKTTLQMLTIILSLALYEYAGYIGEAGIKQFTEGFANGAMWVVAVFTAVSGVVYFAENRELITSNR